MNCTYLLGPPLRSSCFRGTDHSFWVPRLAGKTDLIPNTRTLCGLTHRSRGCIWANALSTAAHNTPRCFCGFTFSRRPSSTTGSGSRARLRSRAIRLRGTAHFPGYRLCELPRSSRHASTGTIGPDLTHLMSRDTIAAGIAENNHENLRLWIQDPSRLKPGSLMPAMGSMSMT